MKSATAYWSRFAVIHCPYCEHVHYLDEEDMMSPNLDGKKMDCEKCKKTFVIEE